MRKTAREPLTDRYEENAILTYWAAIQSGDEIVGQWIRLLYEVILQGLSDKRWFYDHQRAAGALGFIERFCHHYKGKLAPGRIRLSLWERASISLMDCGRLREEAVHGGLLAGWPEDGQEPDCRINRQLHGLRRRRVRK